MRRKVCACCSCSQQALIQQLRDEVAALKQELALLRIQQNRLGPPPPHPDIWPPLVGPHRVLGPCDPPYPNKFTPYS